MKILVDTHYLIWILMFPEKISTKIKKILQSNQNEIICSAVNFWEISLKINLNKIKLENINVDTLYSYAQKSNFQIINLLPSDTITFYKLPITKHKDPFDRMLIWQSINNNYYFLTQDKLIKNYQKYGLKLV